MFHLYPSVRKLNISLLSVWHSTYGHNIFPHKGLKFLFALFSDLQIEHILSFVVSVLHYLYFWILKGNDIAFLKNFSIWFPDLYESAILWSGIFDEKFILVLMYLCMMPWDGLVDYDDIIVCLPADLSRILKKDDLFFKVKLK